MIHSQPVDTRDHQPMIQLLGRAVSNEKQLLKALRATLDLLEATGRSNHREWIIGDMLHRQFTSKEQ